MPIDPRLKQQINIDPVTDVDIWAHQGHGYVGLTDGTEWRFFNVPTWNLLAGKHNIRELWSIALTTQHINQIVERTGVLQELADGRGTE